MRGKETKQVAEKQTKGKKESKRIKREAQCCMVFCGVVWCGVCVGVWVCSPEGVDGVMSEPFYQVKLCTEPSSSPQPRLYEPYFVTHRGKYRPSPLRHTASTKSLVARAPLSLALVARAPRSSVVIGRERPILFLARVRAQFGICGSSPFYCRGFLLSLP